MAFSKPYVYLLNKILLPFGDFIIGSTYTKDLKEWLKYDQCDSESLHLIQQERLRKILMHAQAEVPFYKDKIKFNPNEDAEQVLKKLPILSKALLRSESKNLVADSYNIQRLKKNYSSGSSGVQSFSYSDSNNVFLIQAIQRHWFYWSGFKDGYRVLQFGISPNRGFLKKIKDYFFNVTYESAFSLTDTDFIRIEENIRKKEIKYIIGYPSAIFEFAKYLQKNNKQLAINTIISLGDKLFEHYEKLFNKVMKKPKVIDTYGCAEGFMIACKDDLPYYYISSPHVFIEVVDNKGRAVKEGELGQILVTCLTNYAQPFLRYKLGDLGILLPKEAYPKNAKYNYPLLKKIIGRETDVIKTPAQQTLVVHSFTGIFEHFPEIEQYKIIQNRLSEIEIQYIPERDKNLSLSLQNIHKKLKELTQNSLEINFVEVDKIIPTRSGKPQIIESNLTNN